MNSQLVENSRAEELEAVPYPTEEQTGARIQADYVTIDLIVARYVAMDTERH